MSASSPGPRSPQIPNAALILNFASLIPLVGSKPQCRPTSLPPGTSTIQGRLDLKTEIGLQNRGLQVRVLPALLGIKESQSTSEQAV